MSKKKQRTQKQDSGAQNSDSNSSSPETRKKRTFWKRMIWACLILVAVWLIGDFSYSRYVSSQLRQWEAQITRDDQGVRTGCQAFSVGSGPTGILMVHGFNETPQVWHKMAPYLQEHDFTCRAMRLPGFGEPIEQYASHTIEDWREELGREIKRMQESHSMVILVAHSLGGALTIHYLLDHPGCVDGIALLAPAIETASVRSPFLSTRFWHEFSKYTLPFTRIAMSPFEYDAKDPKERALKLRNKFSPRAVVNNMYQLIDENRGRASEIQVPARFFVSPDDQVIDTEAIKNYFEQLGSKDKKLFEMKNSAHAIPVDLDWQTVADEIKTFANELANPSD